LNTLCSMSCLIIAIDMANIVVSIPHRFVSLNDYINAERTNKYMGAKIKKSETQVAENAFRGLQPILEPCKVRFTWVVTDKRRDLDNIAFAKKYILDGAVSAGVLKGDNMKYIVGFEDVLAFGDSEKVEVEFLEPDTV
jgi:hypothetical protein